MSSQLHHVTPMSILKTITGQDHDSVGAFLLKLLVVSGGTVYSFLASYGQVAVMLITGLYGLCNLYFLIRDKWWRDPKRAARRWRGRR